MALHWNIENCANPDKLKADTPDGWPVTECTIWLCLIVGIDTITDANAEKFWQRVHAWETVSGPMNTSNRLLEPRDVIARIGLHTNASSLSDAAWRKKLAATLADQGAAIWRKTAGGMFRLEQIEKGETQ